MSSSLVDAIERREGLFERHAMRRQAASSLTPGRHGLSSWQGNREGNTGGNRALARGVPPSREAARSDPTIPGGPAATTAQPLSPCPVTACGGRELGGGFCRPWAAHGRVPRSLRHRGVSDHAKWPLALPSLPPRTWSLTPRLNRPSVSVSAPKVHPLVREDSTRNLENNSMNL